MSNDDLLCWERQRFAGIDDKQIIVHFHGLRKRRGHLPKVPVSWQHSINTFLICCLKLLAYLCRIDILICSLRTGYTCNYTLIFSARERIIQAGTNHVCSPCTPCCILCFLVLASFSVIIWTTLDHYLVFKVHVASHFSSYVDFWSASAFVFFKLNVHPW